MQSGKGAAAGRYEVTAVARGFLELLPVGGANPARSAGGQIEEREKMLSPGSCIVLFHFRNNPKR